MVAHEFHNVNLFGPLVTVTSLADRKGKVYRLQFTYLNRLVSFSDFLVATIMLKLCFFTMTYVE